MRHRNVVRFSFCAVVCSVFVLFTACSKDSPTSDGNGSGDGIKTGATTTYPIDASGSVQVKEETSGLTFSFPMAERGPFLLRR